MESTLKIIASPLPAVVSVHGTLDELVQASTLRSDATVLVPRSVVNQHRRVLTRALRSHPWYDLHVAQQGKVLRSAEAALRRIENITEATDAWILSSSNPARTREAIAVQAKKSRARFMRRRRTRFDRELQSGGDSSHGFQEDDEAADTEPGMGSDTADDLAVAAEDAKETSSQSEPTGATTGGMPGGFADK